MQNELHTNSYGGGARSYLGRWYDPELAVPLGLSVPSLVAAEVDRIEVSIAVVLYASQIPRRLGGDASSDDLALDKKRCRRVAHSLQQAHRGWTKKRLSVQMNDEVRQAGAQIIWAEWQGRHFTELTNRARLAVTFAVRSGEPEIVRWGKTAATNYENERRWVSYALRD